MGRTEPSLKLGFASRPLPSETVNGDAVSFAWRDDGSVRFAVIDGLGHGPEAHSVAQTAVAVLAAHPLAGPAQALRLCHDALRGSRGAAISIAELTPGQDGSTRLTFAGVGNVEGIVLSEGKTERPICYRGIVGVTPRQPRAFELDLRPGWTVVIFSDGIRARFALNDIADAADPTALAERLLAEWARPSDDATIVIVIDDLQASVQ